MKYRFLSLLFFLLGNLLLAQQDSIEIREININKFVEGTLVSPTWEENPPLVIMIQGSGPTDRNGNQSFMKNNSFKKLAQELAEEGIATFRYDKRIFQMQKLGLTEREMRFDDFITDASSSLDYFKNQDKFHKIIILGHSQGSLVGMVAAKDKANGFISIAGSARPIDEIITEQVGQQMPNLKESTKAAFDEMRKAGSTSNYNPVLESIFKPELQAFMLSWMKFDPVEEIKELNMPVLIINGTQDLQVSRKEAEALATSKPEAQLVILENMNHVLTPIEGDDLENSKSYNEPNRPLHPELIPVLAEFIKSIE